MMDDPFIQKMFANVRDAMWLLRKTDVRVVGIEIGGLDTHSNQGLYDGPLAMRLEAISYALQSIDTEARNPAFEPASLTTLLMSEFGRTTKQNGDLGTDHGGATSFICTSTLGLNTQVSPVFNEAQWPGLLSANFSHFGCSPTGGGNGKYVDVVTDYRAVIGEVLKKVFAISDINPIIPNYTADGLEGEELGFMS